MINIILVIPHNIDTKIEVYYCNAKDKTPIQCLEQMWENDLSYFNRNTRSKKEVDMNLSAFIKENEEAYLYFKDGSYYHYQLSFASPIATYV